MTAESKTKVRYERPIIRKMNSGLMNKFGTRTEYAPTSHIDSVPVKRIIQEYGSPCFVISERTLRKTYQSALRAFKTRYPKVQFAWSYHCLLYTSPSPRDRTRSRMPSSA